MLGQLADVRAGDERLLARSGQDDHAYDGIVLDVMKRSAQLLHGGHVERVENFGTVDGDVGNRVFLFEQNVGEGHKFALISLSF